MPRPVVLVDYDPAWPEIFEREAARLRPLLGDLGVAIHHVGSTSVPGLTAKPRIDMLPVVRRIEAVDALRAALDDAGYYWRGEYGIPGRRLIGRETGRDGDELPCNIHIFEEGAPEVTRHLLFRDVLRREPETLRRYHELKLRLRDEYPDDTNQYAHAKNPFIDEVLAANGWTAGRAADA